jgi:glutathione S-transferase
MIDLHFAPGNANLAPHMLLHALGLPHRLVPVDRATDAHKSPAYLALNPNGLIPVLVDDDLVLYETAAICLYLADLRPDAGLMPPAGTPARGEATKWLVWMATTLQTTLMHHFYPGRVVGDVAAHADCAAVVSAHAQQQAGALLGQIEPQLQRTQAGGGAWLLPGDRPTVPDYYGLMLCRWTRGFQGDTSPPARTRPGLAPWLQRMLALPEVQRTWAAEGLQAPFI